MVKAQLTKRQNFILQVIDTLERASNQKILEKVSADFDKASRITVVRDLNSLLKKKLIKKSGEGRGVVYIANVPVLKRNFDENAYFAKAPDEREFKKERLNFDKSSIWENLFSAKEIEHVNSLTKQYQKRFSKYNPAQIKQELERITIEFSWKSSHIEGNTYTLLDTERLIKEHKEAKGKTHEEAVMILNHKKALEYVWANPKDFRTISVRKIEDLHSLISADLAIAKGLRRRGVGIIGTAYKPLDNIFQIGEALESLCKLVNGLGDPFLKALVAVSGISYIQPFEDGNKRTSRLIGNALLAAHNYCPLSYRSADEAEYKKAIILFYEQHSLAMFKKMFIEQYEFAVNNYFL
ncbi:Fic family protein [Candidatus Peregrinibacteria bacterium]|nr:Fic family protein [Candidatus Peregrinibacteria bacterium]